MVDRRLRRSPDSLSSRDIPSLCDGWTPPGGGYHGALNHVVIHGLDITVPLREPRRASDTAIRYVLDGQ